MGVEQMPNNFVPDKKPEEEIKEEIKSEATEKKKIEEESNNKNAENKQDNENTEIEKEASIVANKILSNPEVKKELNNPETQKLLKEKAETLQKSDKEKSKKELSAWLTKAKETTKLGGWALGAGVGMTAIFAFLLVFLGLEKLIETGGNKKK